MSLIYYKQHATTLVFFASVLMKWWSAWGDQKDELHNLGEILPIFKNSLCICNLLESHSIDFQTIHLGVGLWASAH